MTNDTLPVSTAVAVTPTAASDKGLQPLASGSGDVLASPHYFAGAETPPAPAIFPGNGAYPPPDANPHAGGPDNSLSGRRQAQEVLVGGPDCRNRGASAQEVLPVGGPDCRNRGASAQEVLPAGGPDCRNRGANAQEVLPTSALRIASARVDLLAKYLEAIEFAPFGNKTKAGKEFMSLYNTGQLFENLYKILGQTSLRTLNRWAHILKSAPDSTLADRRSMALHKPTGILEDQAKILLGVLNHPNRLTESECIRLAKQLMHARGIQDGHSEMTYRRFIAKYKKLHYDQYTANREGVQALNNKCLPYLERDYDKIEVGDIAVADGHKLNFETVHPFTGKPTRLTLILFIDMKSSYPLGWEIMPTENVSSIQSALRRSIIALGKIPRVLYLDNGKAFGAKHFSGQDLSQAGFTGVFARLGCKTIFAWPYHGQSKTIERFFKTFGFVERLAPSYVGTDVYKKPPRLNRGEKLHVKVWEKMTGGNPLTLDETAMIIAWFMDEYVQRPARGGHLKGQTPASVFDPGRGPGVDRRELDYLMLAAENRTLTRNGVSLFGRSYWSPELYGRDHAVTVRYDIHDMTSVLVYDDEGRYLCEAVAMPKTHPAAEALGTAADKETLVRQIAIKKSLEKRTTTAMRRFLKEESYPAQAEQMKSIGIGRPDSPVGQTTRGKSAPPTIGRPDSLVGRVGGPDCRNPGAQAQEALSLVDIRAEADALIEINAQAREGDEERFWDSITELNEGDRYVRLLEMESRGQNLPAEQKTFMRYFEGTEYYSKHSEYFQQQATTFALMREV